MSKGAPSSSKSLQYDAAFTFLAALLAILNFERPFTRRCGRLDRQVLGSHRFIWLGSPLNVASFILSPKSFVAKKTCYHVPTLIEHLKISDLRRGMFVLIPLYFIIIAE